MAKSESNETSKKKIRQVKPTIAKKPKASMRVQAARSRAKADQPKRVRKARDAARKPVSAFGKALTSEYHVVSPKNSDAFFTRSRSLTPRYFSNAWRELRQVTWPGRSETWRLVFAVFLFAVVMGTFIAVLDYGLEKLLREVIL